MNYTSLRHTTLLVFIIIFSGTVSFAQQTENYSRVKVKLDSHHTMMDLARTGAAVDHGEYRKNEHFISDFSETEITVIRNAGFQTETLIKDVIKYYQEQNTIPDPQQKTSAIPCNTTLRPGIDIPSKFHLGTYGGYFTYNEMLQILDSMTLLYPNLISARQQIDTFKSIEGRPLYWMRISNNPNVNQPAKPQMLYTALHHAREPGSLSSTIYYLWYLLEHYNTDPQIKAIVDNTELYFIPCINPDGYVYNVANSPNGGGMWRKNRRNNQNGSFGIDLNRNYGYLWGYNNSGSSNAPSSDVYRGPSAFSEPETRAVKWFSEQHNFKLALNYHSYNNELLSPYGHIPKAYPPDSLEFSAISLLLTNYSFYRYGTCYQCLGYVANGGSDDWMYGEQLTKNKILSFTPEIGHESTGFYPPASRIIPDCKDNLTANINAAALLLPYAKLNTEDPNILTGTSGYLHFNLQRLGMTTGTYTVTATPLDNWITISTTPKTFTGMAQLQNKVDSFSYTLDPNTPNNQSVRYLLKVNNGHYNLVDTIEFYYAKYYSEVKPSSDALTDWTNGGWSLSTTTFRTAPASLKSSTTAGYYPSNANLLIGYNPLIDLSDAKNAYLQFYSRWDIEPKYDYVVISAAENGVSNWTALCGKYTKPGDYTQPKTAPVYDDHQYDWVLEQMDLRAFLGKKINLRFQLGSDNGVPSYDGMYIDDIKVTIVHNQPASVPEAEGNAMTVQVYPLPSTGKITIRCNDADLYGAKAAIFDCTGRCVKDVQLNNRITNTELNLPSGIYYLKVLHKDHSLPVQKIELY